MRVWVTKKAINNSPLFSWSTEEHRRQNMQTWLIMQNGTPRTECGSLQISSHIENEKKQEESQDREIKLQVAEASAEIWPRYRMEHTVGAPHPEFSIRIYEDSEIKFDHEFLPYRSVLSVVA